MLPPAQETSKCFGSAAQLVRRPLFHWPLVAERRRLNLRRRRRPAVGQSDVASSQSPAAKVPKKKVSA